MWEDVVTGKCLSYAVAMKLYKLWSTNNILEKLENFSAKANDAPNNVPETMSECTKIILPKG